MNPAFDLGSRILNVHEMTENPGAGNYFSNRKTSNATRENILNRKPFLYCTAAYFFHLILQRGLLYYGLYLFVSAALTIIQVIIFQC